MTLIFNLKINKLQITKIIDWHKNTPIQLCMMKTHDSLFFSLVGKFQIQLQRSWWAVCLNYCVCDNWLCIVYTDNRTIVYYWHWGKFETVDSFLINLQLWVVLLKVNWRIWNGFPLKKVSVCKHLITDVWKRKVL